VKKVLALILALATIFMAGCSQVNSAATIGDRKIALDDLQTQVDLILLEREGVDTSQMQLESGEALTRSQLSYMISNIIIEELAKDQKIEITPSELESYKAQIFANIGGEAMIQSLVTEKANALKVVVNPRYGTWDAENLTVVAAEPAGDAVTDK